MGKAATQTRTNRTLTIDVQHDATSVQRLGDGQAVLACVLAFILSLGVQRTHKAPCRGGGCRTRPSHDIRGRLGGVTSGRIQGTTCPAVVTVLPHGVWRDRQMRPAMARDVLWATHGGLRVERGAGSWHLAPMARSRLVCALGHQRLVTVLTRCGLALPVYGLAAETHSPCRRDHVYLPTMVHGRVLWPLGSTEDASAAALTPSYQECQRVVVQHAPASRVRGIRTDGFDSTPKRMRTLCPGARLGTGLRPALNKLPATLTASASPVRQALRSQVPTRGYQARQRKGWRVCARGQQWRRCADHVVTMAGAANGQRVRHGCADTKAGW